MISKSEDPIRLLFDRITALKHQLEGQDTHPLSATMVSLATDLMRMLEQMSARMLVLDGENQSLSKRSVVLEQHNRSLDFQNRSLQREKRLLEKRVLHLERQLNLIEGERKRYRDLYEFAPDAYLITDSVGKIQEANQAAAEMLNLRSRALTGQPLSEFIEPADRKLFETMVARVRHLQDMELRVQPKGLSAFDASVTMTTVYDKAGHPQRLRWLLRDVTERHQAMAALDASERRFRTIFNEAVLGIVLVDPNGGIIRCNPTFLEMLGYTEEELHGKSIDELTYHEDLPLSQAAHQSLLDSTHNHIQMEKRYCHKDGRLIWSRVALSLLSYEPGQTQYSLQMVENITAEKQATADLAEMRRRLLESGEVERLRLAQELHDGPMQDLYGAVFRLSNFHDQTCDLEMQANLNEAQDILKRVAGMLRTICGELRPPTIANLGLERAIRSHAERVQENHPEMDVQLHLSNDGQQIPAHTRLAFFRIYQQCMTNVLHHAQASRVMVALHIDDREMALDIWDNGKGFTLPDHWVDLLREGHYGLASIAERVQALCGTLKIETQPGGGTLVHVTAPRENAAA